MLPRSCRRGNGFFRKLLKGLRYVPRVLVTDKLASYPAARHRVMPGVEHRRSKDLNNRPRPPQSHIPGENGPPTLRR